METIGNKNQFDQEVQKYIDQCWVVNAFTNNGLGGGGAAVCILEKYPKHDVMRSVASYYSFSETAFLVKKKPNLYQIRWFTPNSEAPMCGHATLATAAVLNSLQKKGYINHIQSSTAHTDDTIRFMSLSGDIIVTYCNDAPKIILPYKFFPTQICFITPIDTLVEQTPINCFVSNNCLFMEFDNVDEIYDININNEILHQLPYRALCITSRNTVKEEGNRFRIPQNIDFISRYFAPKYAIKEDPVCGSAHCTLTPYWAKKLGKKNLVGYQASKQTGIVICEYEDHGNESNVKLSGETVIIKRPESTNL